MNNLKTAILLILLTAILVSVGSLVGGPRGAAVAFGIAVLMNGAAYWFSDKMVLRMYRAQEVTEAQAPELYQVVANLAQRAGLPMPRVYIIPSPALNAFATGRNPQHAAVAITEGLLRTLDRNELEGVMAHELCHVRHRDILIGSLAATVVGAITMLSSMIRWGAILGGGRSGDGEGGGNPLFAVFASMIAAMAATLVQLAISRSREYEADAGAAKLAGTPFGLIQALRKLELASQRVPLGGSPAAAHLFIVNPLSGGGVMKLFRTHPTTEDRIRRLEGLVGVRSS